MREGSTREREGTSRWRTNLLSLGAQSLLPARVKGSREGLRQQQSSRLRPGQTSCRARCCWGLLVLLLLLLLLGLLVIVLVVLVVLVLSRRQVAPAAVSRGLGGGGGCEGRRGVRGRKLRKGPAWRWGAASGSSRDQSGPPRVRRNIVRVCLGASRAVGPARAVVDLVVDVVLREGALGNCAFGWGRCRLRVATTAL